MDYLDFVLFEVSAIAGVWIGSKIKNLDMPNTKIVALGLAFGMVSILFSVFLSIFIQEIPSMIVMMITLAYAYWMADARAFN